MSECGCIEDKSRKILFDGKQVAERWEEYIEDLYEDERVLAPCFHVSTGEVENVIKRMVKQLDLMKSL